MTVLEQPLLDLLSSRIVENYCKPLEVELSRLDAIYRYSHVGLLLSRPAVVFPPQILITHLIVRQAKFTKHARHSLT